MLQLITNAKGGAAPPMEPQVAMFQRRQPECQGVFPKRQRAGRGSLCLLGNSVATSGRVAQPGCHKTSKSGPVPGCALQGPERNFQAAAPEVGDCLLG